MKFFKRLGIYKNSSGKGTFNPETMQAWSYDWWQMLGRFGGLLVRNRYHYSMPTGHHQRGLDKVLEQLKIKPSHTVYYVCGLQNLSGQLGVFRDKIKVLESEIARPKSRRSTNEVRRERIEEIEKEIVFLNKLLKLKNSPSKESLFK